MIGKKAECRMANLNDVCQVLIALGKVAIVQRLETCTIFYTQGHIIK